eukprot:6190574-Pleurochrysis_carterae.AAC.2
MPERPVFTNSRRAPHGGSPREMHRECAMHFARVMASLEVMSAKSSLLARENKRRTRASLERKPARDATARDASRHDAWGQTHARAKQVPQARTCTARSSSS